MKTVTKKLNEGRDAQFHSSGISHSALSFFLPSFVSVSLNTVSPFPVVLIYIPLLCFPAQAITHSILHPPLSTQEQREFIQDAKDNVLAVPTDFPQTN